MKESFIKKNKNLGFDLEILEDEKKGKLMFDFILPIAVFLLSGFGLLIIYSATKFSMPDGVTDPMYYLKRQGYGLLAAAVIFVVIQFFNYRIAQKFWWIFFLLNIAILGAVLAFGYEVNGSKSWIDLKLFPIQPSELAKILMVISYTHLTL